MSTLSDRQHAFTHALADLFTWMKDQGYEWSLGDAWRSTDTLNCSHCGHELTYQGLLVYNGRSKTAKSAHLDRCALDVILWINGKPSNVGEDYRHLGEYWESLGGTWGGRFSVPKEQYASRVGWDPGHVEM